MSVEIRTPHKFQKNYSIIAGNVCSVCGMGPGAAVHNDFEIDRAALGRIVDHKYTRPKGVLGGPCLTCGKTYGEHQSGDVEEVNMPVEKSDTVDHPKHYGGADNLYEAIKVIEAWSLGFNLGNTVKYICRAGKKIELDEMRTEDSVQNLQLLSNIEDLKKAAWYLNREIENLEKASKP